MAKPKATPNRRTTAKSRTATDALPLVGLDSQQNAAAVRAKDLEGVRVGDVLKVVPEIILREPDHNPRNFDLPENRGHIDWLKASIRESGFWPGSALQVRYDNGGKRVILVDGECRLTAVLEINAEARAAGKLDEIVAELPAIQVPAGNEDDRLLAAILANEGKQLSQWELGSAYRKFQRRGRDIAWIAKRVVRDERFVREAIELADAPLAVLQMLSAERVSPALALSVVREKGDNAAQLLESAATAAEAAGKKATRASVARDGTVREPTTRTPRAQVGETRLTEIARSVFDGIVWREVDGGAPVATISAALAYALGTELYGLADPRVAAIAPAVAAAAEAPTKPAAEAASEKPAAEAVA